MRIHIVDILRLQSSPPERLLHRQERALAIIARCGLVKGVTGIAVATQLTNDLYAPSFGRGCCLKHQIGCTLSEVQTCSIGIKRLTLLVVENHQ